MFCFSLLINNFNNLLIYFLQYRNSFKSSYYPKLFFCFDCDYTHRGQIHRTSTTSCFDFLISRRWLVLFGRNCQNTILLTKRWSWGKIGSDGPKITLENLSWGRIPWFNSTSEGRRRIWRIGPTRQPDDAACTEWWPPHTSTWVIYPARRGVSAES